MTTGKSCYYVLNKCIILALRLRRDPLSYSLGHHAKDEVNLDDSALRCCNFPLEFCEAHDLVFPNIHHHEEVLMEYMGRTCKRVNYSPSTYMRKQGDLDF